MDTPDPPARSWIEPVDDPDPEGPAEHGHDDGAGDAD